MLIIVMGVSGSGKTLIGALLAERLNAVFADADDFHSSANKHKMAAGIPLTDEDRQPWLQSLNRLLRRWCADKKDAVLACSALKEQYREALSDGLMPGDLRFVWLDGSPDLIASRLSHRHHEYMNPGLLASQLATLEIPLEAIHVVNDRSPGDVVSGIVQQLGASNAP